MTPIVPLIVSSMLALDGSSVVEDSSRTDAEMLAPEKGDGDGEAGASASGSISIGSKGADADGSAKADKKNKKAKKKKKAKNDKSKKKGNADSEAAASDGSKTPWIRRYPATRGLVEVGVYGGVYLPGDNHELFEADRTLPEQGFRPLPTVVPDVGARVGYLPLRFLGVELEAGVMPTEANGQPATLWTVRGGVLAQLPRWSIQPFVVAGFGALGVASERVALGSDVDPSLYFGGGAKFNLTRLIQLRLDLRDVVSHKREVDNTFQNHNFEALASFVLVFGRPKPAPPPADTDGDGFIDDEDTCPKEAGVAPDGCPIRDTDGDGFLDPDDACVDEAGVAPDGCPIRDTDGDGFLDDVDACVDEAGVEPDGCPIRDTDGDGIYDDVDDCKDEPETKNGYQDGDGCPDEVPEEIKKFTGVIEGIRFDTNKATIRKQSRPTLDAAAKVLVDFPDVKVEISGHTDNRGSRERNVELSQERANSVRDYLIEKGVDASRIQTRGAGPDEPLDSNTTKAGRAKNRRIEFKIIQ